MTGGGASKTWRIDRMVSLSSTSVVLNLSIVRTESLPQVDTAASYCPAGFRSRQLAQKSETLSIGFLRLSHWRESVDVGLHSDLKQKRSVRTESKATSWGVEKRLGRVRGYRPLTSLNYFCAVTGESIVCDTEGAPASGSRLCSQ